MIKQLLSYFAIYALSIGYIISQVDSSALYLDELGLEDMKPKKDIADDQKMISGGQFLQNKDEIPYTSFIITKEEILDNGYITLVDVMRTLPGVRVSQPGSGAEGETFMLRGLLGNSYMKILVNGNTIKPSIVRGMPIGAQLPIRQAERIEVIYGPAAVMYGSDASIGVINIITKESERPIYAQADLSVGSNGYSSIDVMFGGKLGKNKHVLRYNVYGSNTFMNNRNVFYDLDSLYNPSLYTNMPGLDTNYINNPNYYGSAFNPTMAKTPHLSRLVGFEANYRDLSLSAQVMSRQDHSAIGLSPFAVSYADQGTFIGETIIKSNLAFKKNYKKWGLKTHFNYLRYEMDPNSSNIFIEDKLSRAINQLIFNAPEAVRDSIRVFAYEAIFSDVRYNYALSNDIKAEQLFYINPTNYLGITIGGNANVTAGLAQVGYLNEEYNNDGILIDGTNNSVATNLFTPEPLFFTDWSTFIQTQFDFEQFKGTLGYQYYKHPWFGDAHTPKIALLYAPNNDLNFRASYSSAFRVPPAFYRANTYVIELDDIGEITKANQNLEAESTMGMEVGVRYKKENRFRTDVSLFYNKTDDFISFNFDNEVEIGSNEVEFTQGYFNDGESRAVLYGIQANIEAQKDFQKIQTKAKLNLNYNRGHELLPAGKGRINVVRGQPDFIGQLNISFRFWNESIYLNFTNIYVSSFISSNVLNATAYYNRREEFVNKGFYTLDILARYRISKNFQGYVKIRNVLNKRYAGIDASGTIDDLFYNPQSLRIFNFGLSYRIE